MPHCLPRLQYNWVGFPLPFLGAFVPESVLNISFRKGHICESICVPNDSEEGPVEFHLFSKKIPSSTKRIRWFWKNCATYPFHFRVLKSLVLNHTDKVRGQVKLRICWLYTARKGGRGVEKGEKKPKKNQKKKPETILVLTLHRHLLIRILIQHIWSPNSSLICTDS